MTPVSASDMGEPMQLRLRRIFGGENPGALEGADIFSVPDESAEKMIHHTTAPTLPTQIKPVELKSKETKMVDKLTVFSAAGFLIVMTQIMCEVAKQIINYSMQYYNNGKYPMPQTIIVVLGEIIKLGITLGRSGFTPPSFRPDNLKQSLKFLLPSVMYAINNNIYFAGLMLVPPPIWIILTSFRTVVTASLYKFALQRDITKLQFCGAAAIVLSIVVAKLGDILGSSTGPGIPPIAFLLAAIASLNSVGAALYTESLFKKEGENFLDQQFWLYFYGMIVGCVVHMVTFTTNSLNITGDIFQSSELVQALLVGSLLFGGVGGLIVAAILKRLDNVVKEYCGATANMFTALACSFLFPEKFQFTIYIMMAMVLLFSGIYLYEVFKAKPPATNIRYTHTSESPEASESFEPLISKA